MGNTSRSVSAVIFSVAAGMSALGLTWGAVVAAERLGERREKQQTIEPAPTTVTEMSTDASTEDQRRGSNPIATVFFVCLTMIAILLFAEWNASRFPTLGPITDEDLLPSIVGLTTVLF